MASVSPAKKSSAKKNAPAAVLAAVRDVLGPDRVITDGPKLAYYVTDIAGEANVRPLVAIKPATVDGLARAIGLLTDADIAIIPRGAGYSYSGGYQPVSSMSAIIDLTDLNQITEINETDRYVTVEASCTWASLYDALKARGLRTPFFGPLSGSVSTVGGAASNNAQFFGSGAYGTMSDNVLSVDVVLADGSIIETGSAIAEGRTPFFRHFGPDLTGLFLGDCGAFGVKARITMPLIPLPAVQDYLSFAFERFEDLAEAHVALARENIVAEQWGIDPQGNDNLAARGFKFLEGLSFLREVANVQGGLNQKIATLARTLVDGHRAVVRGGYSLHLVIEGDSAKDVELKIGRARRILVPLAMKELPNTIPQVTRAKPFRTIKQLLGPEGENWLPVHGIFPFSRAMEISAITDEYFVRHRDLMKQHNISVSYLTGALSNAFTIEPMFFWKDRLHAFHQQHVTDAQRSTYGDAQPDPAARAAVATLRHDLAMLWDAFGATHFQVGKYYDYTESLSSASAVFVKALKAAVDPHNLMNPGALQLGVPPKVQTNRFTEFPQNLLDEHD
ncbi:MAG: FAD-binding oxidoreductase [Rhodospirillaceae bacterium]|nr:FAD-binding oxidoreductase [Rhodospirillaceae bacterium]